MQKETDSRQHQAEQPADVVERVADAVSRNIAGQMKAVVTLSGYTAFGEHNLNCLEVAKAAIAAMEGWQSTDSGLKGTAKSTQCESAPPASYNEKPLQPDKLARSGPGYTVGDPIPFQDVPEDIAGFDLKALVEPCGYSGEKDSRQDCPWKCKTGDFKCLCGNQREIPLIEASKAIVWHFWANHHAPEVDAVSGILRPFFSPPEPVSVSLEKCKATLEAYPGVGGGHLRQLVEAYEAAKAQDSYAGGLPERLLSAPSDAGSRTPDRQGRALIAEPPAPTQQPVEMPQDKALKPCPFCGCTGVLDDSTIDRTVVCSECGAQPRHLPLHHDQTKREAYAVWNKRATPERESVTQWSEWTGGSCPVSQYAIVEIELRDTPVWFVGYACAWHWPHSLGKGDILRYRILHNEIED